MLKALRGAAVAAAALLVTVGISYASGMWSQWPGVGQAAFCSSYSTQSAGQVCTQNVPAGPATFAGTEYAPFDIGPLGSSNTNGGAQSASVSVLQLGQGPVVDNNVAGAAQTIPNNTSFFVLDTNTPTTVTVTMPAAAVEGQEVHLVCGIAISVALTVSANNGQTMKGAAPSTCTAGQAFAWRYIAAANGAIVAASWLRVQ